VVPGVNPLRLVLTGVADVPVAGLSSAVTVAVSPPVRVEPVPQRKVTADESPLAFTVPLRVAAVEVIAVAVEVVALGAATAGTKLRMLPLVVPTEFVETTRK